MTIAGPARLGLAGSLLLWATAFLRPFRDDEIQKTFFSFFFSHLDVKSWTLGVCRNERPRLLSTFPSLFIIMISIRLSFFFSFQPAHCCTALIDGRLLMTRPLDSKWPILILISKEEENVLKNSELKSLLFKTFSPDPSPVFDYLFISKWRFGDWIKAPVFL